MSNVGRVSAIMSVAVIPAVDGMGSEQCIGWGGMGWGGFDVGQNGVGWGGV